MRKQTEQEVFEEINILDIIGIVAVLLVAFFFQFYDHEVPCPLCLLQRFGFYMMAFGLMMNITFSLRPRNYAMSAIAALFTAAAGLRQMFLHIVPGTGSYGGALFGWHLYTWSFVFSSLFLIFTFCALLFEKQFQSLTVPRTETHEYIARFLLALYIILLLVNMVATFMECGYGYCPDNPMNYIHTLF